MPSAVNSLEAASRRKGGKLWETLGTNSLLERDLGLVIVCNSDRAVIGANFTTGASLGAVPPTCNICSVEHCDLPRAQPFLANATALTLVNGVLAWRKTACTS
jgi:hypothetical protein